MQLEHPHFEANSNYELTKGICDKKAAFISFFFLVPYRSIYTLPLLSLIECLQKHFSTLLHTGIVGMSSCAQGVGGWFSEKPLTSSVWILKFLNVNCKRTPEKLLPNIEHNSPIEMLTAASTLNCQVQELCMDIASMVVMLIEGVGA